MYETEANNRTELISQIPLAVQQQLQTFAGKIIGRTVLPWGEHCTECVWPTCYSTCDLYSPREDLRCRRFTDGMVRIDCPGSLNTYLTKISFKQWGKLWTPGNIRLYDLDDALKREQWDYRFGTMISLIPLPSVARKVVTGRRYKFKADRAQSAQPSKQLPTSFLVECYNPAETAIGLSITMRPTASAAQIPFQALVEFQPGFKRLQIPVDEISANIDLQSPFEIEMIPNDVPDGTTLYFGMIDFIREEQQPPERSRTIKCVVWDLDNTLWDGTLIEDGADKLRLKPGIVEVIRDLDRRGILNSIASKNDFDDAWAVVKKFGIDGYFVAPSISWGPKSESIVAIARELNIGIDSLLFLDDSRFELEQVVSACPDVRVLSASDYQSLPYRPECQGAVTKEGASRRKLYQDEALRKKLAMSFSDDYLSFLRHCNLVVGLKRLDRSNLDRVHELTQRTNQMNFSGTHYNRGILEALIDSQDFDTYVMDCSDRFGSYGVIGFSVVDRREPRMTDLMFSCRIQSKRVEHAFMSHIIRHYIGSSNREFWANYRKTSRNAPSGRVFADLGMKEMETRHGVTSLMFPHDREILNDDIVQIVVHEPVGRSK